MAKLENKTSIVTGGSSGIGRAVAERFAKEGARVLIVGRKEDALRETAATSDKISYVVGDITKTETIERIMQAVEERFNGQLDILVNNAGWCPVQPITEITPETASTDPTDRSIPLSFVSLPPPSRRQTLPTSSV